MRDKNDIKRIMEFRKQREEDIANADKNTARIMREIDENIKREINEILRDISKKKLKKARKLFEGCMFFIEGELVEQVYRAFYSSLKIRYSYSNFKDAALTLLYLYGYITEKEADILLSHDLGKHEKIWEKHKEDMSWIKEVDDVLSKEEFYHHIPMNVGCLAVGASISFTLVVKSILDVVERLHSDKKYRKSHQGCGTLDWDEAILLRALPFTYCKKGGKKHVLVGE